MATYQKVPRSVPSSQRTTIITEVEAGDRINIEDILGRPARQIKIVPDHSTDQISFKLNNFIRLEPKDKTAGTAYLQPTVEVWSSGAAFSTFSVSGEDSYLSEEELRVSSIEIVDITFGDGGTAIQIVVW